MLLDMRLGSRIAVAVIAGPSPEPGRHILALSLISDETSQVDVQGRHVQE